MMILKIFTNSFIILAILSPEAQTSLSKSDGIALSDAIGIFSWLNCSF
jgi:hypothetical protein